MSAINDNVLINGFSIKGNDDELTTTLQAAEVKSLQILKNNSMGLIRNLVIAQNISMLSGIGTAIYSLPRRLVYGTDWNEQTGAVQQDLGLNRTSLQLDQQITFKYQAPKGDLKRLSAALVSGEINVAESLLTQIAGSLVFSAIATLEAALLKGIKDYTISKSGETDSVLPLDLLAIKDEASAVDAFYSINDKMIDKIRTINETEIGTNKDDWFIVFDMKAFAKLTRAYVKFIGTNVSPTTLAQGSLYESSILGTSVMEHALLGQNLKKGMVNKDIEFDLSDVQAVAIHKDAIAMPLMWEETAANINYNNNQLVFTGRLWTALPMVLRPNLVFTIMAKQPTAEQIAAAKAMVKTTGTTNPNDSFKKSFQLADYDQYAKTEPKTNTSSK